METSTLRHRVASRWWFLRAGTLVLDGRPMARLRSAPFLVSQPIGLRARFYGTVRGNQRYKFDVEVRGIESAVGLQRILTVYSKAVRKR